MVRQLLTKFRLFVINISFKYNNEHNMYYGDLHDQYNVHDWEQIYVYNRQH